MKSLFALLLISLLFVSCQNNKSNTDQSSPENNTVNTVPETKPDQTIRLNLMGDALLGAVNGPSFCTGVITAEIASQIAGEPMELVTDAPGTDGPRTCRFLGPKIQFTITALAGTGAKKAYGNNVESFGAGDVKEELGDLGQSSFGYNFRGQIITDVYFRDLWLNVAVVGRTGEADKIQMVRKIVNTIGENL